jgi:hypothetical protein
VIRELRAWVLGLSASAARQEAEAEALRRDNRAHVDGVKLRAARLECLVEELQRERGVRDG